MVDAGRHKIINQLRLMYGCHFTNGLKLYDYSIVYQNISPEIANNMIFIFDRYRHLAFGF